MTQVPGTDWTLIAATPLDRIRAAYAYATRVFEDEAHAATWLGRSNRSVRGGLCAVGAACQEAEGFRETIAELGRLERIAQQKYTYPSG